MTILNLPRTHPLIYNLDDKNYNFLVSALEEFISKAIPKYVNGVKEHGGFIADREMLPEAKSEIIDLWMYLVCMKQRIDMIHEIYFKTLGSEIFIDKEKREFIIKNAKL